MVVHSSSVAADPEVALKAGHEQRASEFADENAMAQQQGGEPESKGDEAGVPESKGDGDSETHGDVEDAQQSSEITIANQEDGPGSI